MSVEQWFKENVKKVATQCCGACVHAKEFKDENGESAYDYCQQAVDDTGCNKEDAVVDTCYLDCACAKFKMTKEYANELQAESWWNSTGPWFKPSCKRCSMSAKMADCDKLYCKYMQNATGLPEKNCFIRTWNI